MGGLDPNVSEEDLRQTFSQYGEISSVKIPVGKQCGFVQFAQRYEPPHTTYFPHFRSPNPSLSGVVDSVTIMTSDKLFFSLLPERTRKTHCKD